MESPIPVHVGLLGHIDHGKTALARVLSEHVSTAGLDKHPQAKERGITIDLGFTMFILDKFLVTLVDAPGHADLIRSVVAGANIIDTAILTVAADEGPKIQTGEHLIVLSSLGIDSLVVAITKIDIANSEQITKVEIQIRKIVEDAGFKRVEYVRVSAQRNEGIDQLRQALLKILTPRERDTKGSFLMPIDHVFPVKGHGTVVTGTILRGKISLEDLMEIAPIGTTSRVRSIQTFGQNRNEAVAGERIGVNIPEADATLISRGDYLCAPKSLLSSNILYVRIVTNPLYRGRVTKSMIVSVALGMPVSTASISPFIQEGELRVVVDSTDQSEFSAALVLQRSLAIDMDARILLLRTDLPPTQMRIIGSGTITEIPDTILLHRRKTRTGKVQRIRESDVLIEGLASSKKVAESLVGMQVLTRSGIEGIIRGSFGTRGVVIVEFKGPVSDNEDIIYQSFVKEASVHGP